MDIDLAEKKCDRREPSSSFRGLAAQGPQLYSLCEVWRFYPDPCAAESGENLGGVVANLPLLFSKPLL
jgi:hypothetical protein